MYVNIKVFIASLLLSDRINITFDKFTGVTLYSLNIGDYEFLQLVFNLPKGRTKFKLTQGNLMNANIYEKDISEMVGTFDYKSLENLDKNKKLDI